MKLDWNDILAGYDGEHIHLGSVIEDDMIKVTVNENTVFSGTQSDAYVTFIGLSKLFGPKMCKALLKVKSPGEQLVKND